MLSRNEEGDAVNNFGIDCSAAYSASPGGGGGGVGGGGAGGGGTNGVSRASLGNYNALLSLSRMGSKEDDCNSNRIPCLRYVALT